jgi:hypothetical protein
MVIQRVYGHDSDLSIRHGGRLRGRRMGDYVGGGWETRWAADGKTRWAADGKLEWTADGKLEWTEDSTW